MKKENEFSEIAELNYGENHYLFIERLEDGTVLIECIEKETHNVIHAINVIMDDLLNGVVEDLAVIKNQ